MNWEIRINGMFGEWEALRQKDWPKLYATLIFFRPDRMTFDDNSLGFSRYVEVRRSA